MPIGQINLHSATTEELFERLAWFYATAKQVGTDYFFSENRTFWRKTEKIRKNFGFSEYFRIFRIF
jgi:hypothetical protein